MVDLIQQYNENNIWHELVNFDFSNKNHKNFSPLFEHIKEKISSLDISLGINAFYEWKKAHRFYYFFKSINIIIPRESKQWLATQNEALWNIIAGEPSQNLFRKLKNELKNPDLTSFFNSIFGTYNKYSVEKEAIVEKMQEVQILFENNIKKSKNYYFIPFNDKIILKNFSPQTLFKAKNLALKNDLDGYYFVLNYDNVYKLLTYISSREIREDVYIKFNEFMNSCQFQKENQKLLNKGLILKKTLANVYGHKNYSNLVASKYMVTLNQTQKFLNESERQLNLIMNQSNILMLEMFHSDGFVGDIQPWDFSYYQRLLRIKYVIDTKIENHFQFDITFPKILKEMEKIFNVSIKYINQINSNEIYEIKDNLNVKKTAYWIVAPFLRKNETTPYEVDMVKCTNIGEKNIPWIQFIYLNLKKNRKMNFLNVKNTIHELGHAFHSFFSDSAKSKETFGWDLIELPSQFLENLAYRYSFLSKISSSTYFSKKIFKQEIKNYTFNDIFSLNEKIIDFQTSFDLNKNINSYSNKKIIKKLTQHRHSVGNFYNPFNEAEHFVNSYERDYFANYVYFFSGNIAKQLSLLYNEKDFRKIFKTFDLDKQSFKNFIQSKINITNINLVEMFNHTLFDK